MIIKISKVTIYIYIVSLFIQPIYAIYADDIYLTNNDRITGEIVEESDGAVSIKTEAMGIVSVQKNFIDRVTKAEDAITKAKEKEVEIITDGEISLGYNANRGNTKTEEIFARAFFNRNRKHIDEWTFKGDLYYSEVDREINAQKWYGMGRYAFSFGPRKAWYNFYRCEADHDRFANIHFRIVPAGGIGYWFFDLPELKLLAETAMGLEYSDFRDDTKDTYTAVLIPRGYGEIKLFDRLTLSQDIYFYPVVYDFENYRIRSETACTVDINEKFALRMSLIDDYNSRPPEDTKKNDLSLMSSLVYSF